MKYISSSSEFGQKLLNRFIKYVKIWTESDSSIADEGTIPSTKRQFDFANLLKEELISLGLTNVQVTENCYVYALLPSTKQENATSSLCLLAHMDTSEEVSGKDVNPILHKNYDGKILQLNSDISINPQNDTYLAKTANTSDTIITSDGSTLLGADNKAGIAEIVTALEYLCNHKEIQHCAIEVVFSPDEETGHGMDKVPMDLIKSKVAYTVDGGDLGQLETECFNAASATVTFTGKTTHPGSAKESGMINAILAAASFLESLPKNELPETTEHYQGFYAPMDISSTVEKAEIHLILRDFDLDGLNKRIQFVKDLALAVEQKTKAKSSVETKYQYFNMKNEIEKSPDVVNKLKIAYNMSEVEPVLTPIRGGTDGSRLTEMGIPTPNIFTGGHNFHSRTEWASLNQMCSATNVIINLVNIS